MRIKKNELPEVTKEELKEMDVATQYVIDILDKSPYKSKECAE